MTLSSSDLKKLETESAVFVRTAGAHVLNKWNDLHSLTYKNKRDVASEVDIEIENELRQKLGQLLPEAGFIVEEGKTAKKNEYNWAIDPIDGTKNYVANLPMFFTQIALLENDESVLGHIFNPVSGQFFSGSRGNGATMNGDKLKNMTRTNMDEAILDIDFGGNDDVVWKMNVLTKLVHNSYRVRITGGFLHPYLLTGAVDASLILDPKTKLVDYLPSLIMMKEIGLKVESFSMSNHNNIILASNPTLFDQIRRMMY